MDFILGLFLAVVLLVAANFVDRQKEPSQLSRFEIWMGLQQLPLLAIGVFFNTAPPAQLQALQAGGLLLADFARAGLVFVGMGVWGLLVVLRPVRRVLGRLMPRLRADSAVHLLALVLCGYLVGNTAVTLAQGGLDALADVTVSASIWDVILQQGLFVFLAFMGAGAFIRRSGQPLRERLGLTSWRSVDWGVIIRWTGVLLILQTVIGAVWAVLDPQQSEMLSGINDVLLADFDTVWEWFLLAAASGIGEELLFRGALQPILGLGVTSVLFAVAHVQYGITPITLVVLLLGFILGIVRKRHGTTTAILIHFSYNFVLGMGALLAGMSV